MAELSAGGKRHESFSGLLLRHRGRMRLTQRQLAERIGVSMHTVQGWETGVMYPSSTRLQALIIALLEAGGLAAGHEWQEAEDLWAAVDREASRAHPPFDRGWFSGLVPLPARPQTQPAVEQAQTGPPLSVG